MDCNFQVECIVVFPTDIEGSSCFSICDGSYQVRPVFRLSSFCPRTTFETQWGKNHPQILSSIVCGQPEVNLQLNICNFGLCDNLSPNKGVQYQAEQL